MTTTLIENRQKKVKLDLRRIRRSLREIKKTLGCLQQEISLLFVDDEGIREINRQYLNRDYPTNVISFALQEGAFGHLNSLLLGDIVVSVERALQDAHAGDVSFDDAMDYFLIHGLLHLLGYDHEGPDECRALKMQAKEDEIFLMLKGYPLDRA